MKRYIDCIHVNDHALAYAIMNALERDGVYSVEYREARSETRRDVVGFEIKVLKEEHPIPSTIGFTDGEPKCEEGAYNEV